MSLDLLLYANLALSLAVVGALIWLAGRDGNRSVRDDLERLERGMRDEIKGNRAEAAQLSKALREEVQGSLKGVTDSVLAQMSQLSHLQKAQFDGFAQRIEQLSAKIDDRLRLLQEGNEKKLDQMRATVDEKLQGTLEKRLGESFRLVSERLEQVHKGLGEMQTLANGVGDLKKVLTNVKTRGTWGEIQLGALLEQVLRPDQYGKDVACRPGSLERVEYAIRLPGKGDGDPEVLLPIDAKFPQEDYQRLLEAADRADAEGVEAAAKALELRVKGCAKDIRDKYIHPPHTTDFAILFLPTEGLYAEVLRRPGLVDALQRDYRVNPAGPTTLGALLNSLQMGFKTLAIEKRSSEVWQVLGAVKTEFAKYGEVLDKVKKKLDEASKTVEDVSIRKRAIDRKLRAVEALPVAETSDLLALPEADLEDA